MDFRIKKLDQLGSFMPNCPLKEAAQDTPDLLAVISKDRNLTFRELDQEADRMEIPPATVIPIAEPLSWRTIALFFGAWRKGSSVCPLNLRLPKEKLEQQMAACKSLSPEYPLYLYTSGSTGIPKLACFSLSNFIESAIPAIEALDLRPNDQWLLSLPIFHVGGIGILFRCILARAVIAIDSTPDITHLSYVPAQLYRSSPVYKKLRCLMLGGASIASYPPKLPVYMTYGLTEMSSLVCVRHHPPLLNGHYYLGHSLKGREIKIGSDGEIWVRGSCRFQGYWENGKMVSSADWFPTKDLGHYDPKEGLAIIGRKDWQFISGGENIQPEEIERELIALPQVSEAVVIPIADPEFGMRPVAVVKSHSSFSLKEMQEALKPKLPKYKIPIKLYLVDEIPKTGLKIDRTALVRFISSQDINNK